MHPSHGTAFTYPAWAAPPYTGQAAHQAGHPHLLALAGPYPMDPAAYFTYHLAESHAATTVPRPTADGAHAPALVAPTPHYPGGPSAALASLLSTKFGSDYFAQLSPLVEGSGPRVIRDVFFTDAAHGVPVPGDEVSLQSILDLERLSPPSSPSKLDADDASSLFGYDFETCSTVCGSPRAEEPADDDHHHPTALVSPFGLGRVLTPPQEDAETPVGDFEVFTGSPASKRRRLATAYPSPDLTSKHLSVQTVSPCMLMHAVAVPSDETDVEAASDDAASSADESGDEYVPRLAVPTGRSFTPPANAVAVLRTPDVTLARSVSTPRLPTRPVATPEPANGVLPENEAREITAARPTQRPTLYEQLSRESIDWCRYCGTTEGINWRPGPWGKRTLCNKHGCDYKGYGFACKLPRLDLRAYARESIEERERPILQLYCTGCHDPRSYVGNALVRCEGCPKAFHQHCCTTPIPDPAAQSTEPWFCDAACRQNCRTKRVVVELPRKRLPLMCSPKAGENGPSAAPASETPNAAVRPVAAPSTVRRGRRPPSAALPPSPSPSVEEVACDRPRPVSRKRKAEATLQPAIAL